MGQTQRAAANRNLTQSEQRLNVPEVWLPERFWRMNRWLGHANC